MVLLLKKEKLQNFKVRTKPYSASDINDWVKMNSFAWFVNFSNNCDYDDQSDIVIPKLILTKQFLLIDTDFFGVNIRI